MKRREFLKISADAAPLALMAQAPDRKYELLIKGGRVIDPSQSPAFPARIFEGRKSLRKELVGNEEANGKRFSSSGSLGGHAGSALATSCS